MPRVEAIVRGIVQGVGFRYHVKELSNSFKVTGYVRNLPDGCVEIVCEGDTEELRAFIEAIKRLPPPVMVEGVEETWKEASSDIEGFHIYY